MPKEGFFNHAHIFLFTFALFLFKSADTKICSKPSSPQSLLIFLLAKSVINPQSYVKVIIFSFNLFFKNV